MTATATDPRTSLSDHCAGRDPRVREDIVTRYLPLARSLARRFATCSRSSSGSAPVANRRARLRASGR